MESRYKVDCSFLIINGVLSHTKTFLKQTNHIQMIGKIFWYVCGCGWGSVGLVAATKSAELFRSFSPPSLCFFLAVSRDDLTCFFLISSVCVPSHKTSDKGGEMMSMGVFGMRSIILLLWTCAFRYCVCVCVGSEWLSCSAIFNFHTILFELINPLQ